MKKELAKKLVEAAFKPPYRKKQKIIPRGMPNRIRMPDEEFYKYVSIANGKTESQISPITNPPENRTQWNR